MVIHNYKYSFADLRRPTILISNAVEVFKGPLLEFITNFPAGLLLPDVDHVSDLVTLRIYDIEFHKTPYISITGTVREDGFLSLGASRVSDGPISTVYPITNAYA